MPKKKITEKADNLKTLFEKLNITVEENQLNTIVKNYDALIDGKIKEETNKFKKKTSEYQKRNAELAAKLEEKTILSKKFDAALDEKIELIKNINIPTIDDFFPIMEEKIKQIEKSVVDKVDRKMKRFNTIVKQLENMSKDVEAATKKIQAAKIYENLDDVNKIGKIFSNYKQQFVDLITETESKDINALRMQLEEITKNLTKSENKNGELQREIVRERETTEITLILENSDIDEDDKKMLYSIFEKIGYDAKSEIEDFIKRNDVKKAQRKQTRTYTKESVNRPKNDMGLIRRKPITEKKNEWDSSMDEWANLAGVDEIEK